jgi:hypothetical protein
VPYQVEDAENEEEEKEDGEAHNRADFCLGIEVCQKVWEGADWISGTTELGAKLEGCEGERAGAEVESRLDGEGI